MFTKFNILVYPANILLIGTKHKEQMKMVGISLVLAGMWS